VHFVVCLECRPPYEPEGKGEFRLYHIDGTLIHIFKGHAGSVNAMTVTPDGQHVISGTSDGYVNVWNVASLSLVSTCDGRYEHLPAGALCAHTDTVSAVAAMPDGQRILSGSMDKTVRVWLLDGTLKNTFWHVTGSLAITFGGVNALVALPDNQHALSGSDDRTVKLFNVDDGDVLRTFKHHTDAVFCLALLPDGLRFVSGSRDKTARIAYHGLAPQ
jgi:WD40 repeat protein